MTEFSPWAKEHRANPHPLYDRMRAEAPVYRGVGPITGRGFWFLTRYDDAVSALRDRRIGKEVEKHIPDVVLEQDDSGLDVFGRSMLFVDPPDHTRLRRLVAKAFTPRAIASLEQRIAAIADDLLDSLEGRPSIDLIDDFAFPLPVTVIAELLGVPVEDREKFRRWTKTLLFADTIEHAQVAGFEFIAYMNDQIDQRRSQPADDLITHLVHHEDEGDRLDHAETLSMILLLLIAGHETTVNLIGNGMLALLDHPDELQRLRADPGLVAGAIEEMLRYDGPVEIATIRWAFEDVEIGGVTIPAGEIVVPVLSAANRDPAVFENPGRFDASRPDNRHIAFGSGIHQCLGAPLARLEATVAFPRLLARAVRLEAGCDTDDLPWNEALFLRGVKWMPLNVVEWAKPRD
ncbi:MAG: cytochrome P450 [Acidimicrobiia bacterium]|nr:cytochrome P450 [Acidimicrobiia bacterium]